MFIQINVCANFGLNLLLPNLEETNVSNDKTIWNPIVNPKSNFECWFRSNVWNQSITCMHLQLNKYNSAMSKIPQSHSFENHGTINPLYDHTFGDHFFLWH
jgi:hypothetical protein